MATEGKKGDKVHSSGEIKLNVGVFSIRLPTDLESDETPQTLAELKAHVVRDLLSIAAGPTKILSQIMQGLVRIVRVVTFDGGHKKSERKQFATTEALAQLQAVLEKNNAVILKGENDHPVILIGELAQKALTDGSEDIQLTPPDQDAPAAHKLD